MTNEIGEMLEIWDDKNRNYSSRIQQTIFKEINISTGRLTDFVNLFNQRLSTKHKWKGYTTKIRKTLFRQTQIRI